MRFLVDECTSPAVADWLRQLEHDVASIYQEGRGMGDGAVLGKAVAESRILMTNDKDFGDLIFRSQNSHEEIILLRLDDERNPNKIGVLARLLGQYSDQLPGNFVVATDTSVRITHPPFQSATEG